MYVDLHVEVGCQGVVLLAEKGFNLKANIKARELVSETFFSGKHTHENAFLLTQGVPEEQIPRNPNITDVRTLIDENGIQG